MDLLIDVFFSYRANEFVRHVILDCFRSVLRGGTQFSQMREMLLQTTLLSAIPTLYRNKPQMKRYGPSGLN